MTINSPSAESEKQQIDRNAVVREPHLLRFSLRNLLVFVAAISMVLASLVITEGAWPLAIGVTVLVVAAHVFGTLIGTRLRDTSKEVRQWRWTATGESDHPVIAPQRVDELRDSLPPQTMLADQATATRRDLIATTVGGMLGFMSGATVILTAAGENVSWPGVAIGAFACGVLAGGFAWLAAGFGFTARRAWKDAKAVESRS